MKHRLTLFLFLVFLLKNQAQELIFNGDFEAANLCAEYSQECSPSGWYGTSFERNSFGYVYFPILAKSGKHYAFVQVEGVNALPDERSYIQTMLLCPLQVGKKYRLSYFLRKMDKDSFQRIGLLFLTKRIADEAVLQGKYQPQFFHTEQDFDKTSFKKWKKISFEFTPDSNYSYMVLGNFDAYQAMTMTKKAHHSKNIRYYIDDISLKSLEKIAHCNDYYQNQVKLKFHTQRHSLNGFPTDKLFTPTIIAKSNTQEKLPPPPPKSPSSVFEKPVQKITAKTEQNSTQKVIQKDSFLQKEKEKEIVVTKNKVDTIILPNILFAFDSYQLNPNYENILKDALEKLKTQPFSRLEIIGHTDNIGSDNYNQKLSFQRANTIANYLIVNDFCKKEKLIFKGKGASEPKNSNSTDSERQANRRVEVLIFH